VTPLEALAVAAAGVAAGAINAVVGSGTLITFPTLLAIGLPPVTANVTNTVGLVPGSFSAVVGYRRELAGQGAALLRLLLASITGALTGGLLLLVLPAAAFRAIVPALIALGCILVVVQPFLARRLAQRQRPRGTGHAAALISGVFLTGIYGGYFGAAQGVLLLALLGVLHDADLQRSNAAKNVLAAFVNLAAAVLFVVTAEVRWDAAALVAVGAVAGAFVGAKVGRRIPQAWLRGVIVVVGVVAIVQLLA